MQTSTQRVFNAVIRRFVELWWSECGKKSPAERNTDGSEVLQHEVVSGNSRRCSLGLHPKPSVPVKRQELVKASIKQKYLGFGERDFQKAPFLNDHECFYLQGSSGPLFSTETKTQPVWSSLTTNRHTPIHTQIQT